MVDELTQESFQTGKARLFTTLYNRLLKVGRVQTPTLAMFVDRESQIMNFKKQAYYQTHILCDGFEAVTDHIDEYCRSSKNDF